MAQALKVLFLSCVVGGMVFCAQPGTVQAQTDIPAAREAYQRATAEFGLGNYAEAATEYEKAFRFKPDPALLFNAAQAYRLAGNKPRAVQLYRNYLRLFPAGVAAGEARKHVETLEAESTPKDPVVAKPEPAPPNVPATPGVSEAEKNDLTIADRTNPDEKPSLLANPWFWAGAAAAAIAVTTIVLVVSSGSDPENPDATWGRVVVK